VGRPEPYASDRSVGTATTDNLGDADERGQVAVLVSELDELDAPFAALECVAQAAGLRGPDHAVAVLLPCPEQRAKSRRTVTECGRSKSVVEGIRRRVLAALPLAKKPGEIIGRGDGNGGGERLSRCVSEHPNTAGERRGHEHADPPAME